MGLKTSRLPTENLDTLLPREKRCGIIVSQNLENLFSPSTGRKFSFGTSFKINLEGKEKHIIMAIQCLVYPRGIRIPFGFDDQLFIIDDYTNIRPIGILYKEVESEIIN